MCDLLPARYSRLIRALKVLLHNRESQGKLKDPTLKIDDVILTAKLEQLRGADVEYKKWEEVINVLKDSYQGLVDDKDLA